MYFGAEKNRFLVSERRSKIILARFSLLFSDFIIDTVSIPCINFFYISEIKILFENLSIKMELKDT